MNKFILLLLCFTSYLYSHTYHFTTAEVEWNDSSKCLEVALCVQSLDLEKALLLFHKKKLSIDDTKDIDSYIIKYLEDKFTVHENRNAKPLKWIGKEVEIQKTWLYFEIAIDKKWDTLEIQHSVFFELPIFDAQRLHNQINIINFRYKNKKTSLYFTMGKGKKVLDISVLQNSSKENSKKESSNTQ